MSFFAFLAPLTQRVAAENPSHFFIHLSDIRGYVGETRELTVNLDFGFECDPESCAERYIKGWSYALCHDPSLLRVTDCGPISASLAADTAQLNRGAGPDFLVLRCQQSEEAQGVIVGVVVSATGSEVIPPVRSWEDITVRYELQGEALLCSEGCETLTRNAVWICDRTLGIPPVDCVAVNPQGQSERFRGYTGGTVTVRCPACSNDFFITLSDGVSAPGGSADVTVTLDFDHDPSQGPSGEISGWSYGVCSDTSAATPIEATAQWGETPRLHVDFFEVSLPQDIDPPCENRGGVAVNAIVSLSRDRSLSPQNGWVDLRIRYRVADLPCGAEASRVYPCDTVGCPPVRIAMERRSGASFPLSGYKEGAIRIGCDEILFVRGDVDGNRAIELDDPVGILAFLFEGGTLREPTDSADSNDDGVASLTDAAYLLCFLFQQGPPPLPPYPEPGPDPTPDTLK